MKNLSIRVFAALLMVWYCLSIIGFGVHTCSESNRSFLTNFISGVNCEDIHPSDLCESHCCAKAQKKSESKCCCCGGHSHETETEIPLGDVNITQSSCCSNDYQQIEVTGAGMSSSLEQIDLTCLHLAVSSVVSSANLLSNSKNTNARYLPDKVSYKGKVCQLYGVWRI